MRGFLVCLGLCLFAVSHADTRQFAYSYSWYTMPKGSREFEVWSTHAGADKWQGQAELEYGVTDRFTVAPYFVYETELGEQDLKGGKLEARYRFGDFAVGRLLPAVYAELEKMDKEDYELELKLIASFAPTAGTLLSANLVYSKSLGSEEPEWGYTFGAADVSRSSQWYGVEAFGNLKGDADHYVGPTFGTYLGEARLLVSPAFSLNKQPNRLRFILSWYF